VLRVWFDSLCFHHIALVIVPLVLTFPPMLPAPVTDFVLFLFFTVSAGGGQDRLERRFQRRYSFVSLCFHHIALVIVPLVLTFPPMLPAPVTDFVLFP
jgi:hypothetical protein